MRLNAEKDAVIFGLKDRNKAKSAKIAAWKKKHEIQGEQLTRVQNDYGRASQDLELWQQKHKQQVCKE